MFDNFSLENTDDQLAAFLLGQIAWNTAHTPYFCPANNMQRECFRSAFPGLSRKYCCLRCLSAVRFVNFVNIIIYLSPDLG